MTTVSRSTGVVIVVGGGRVVGVVGGAPVVGVVGAAVVGAPVVGVTGLVVTGGMMVTVGGGVVVAGERVVVAAGRVVDVDTGGLVVLVVDTVLGWVGNATVPWSDPPRTAKNTISPMAQAASPPPAIMRDARTSCPPLRVPCERPMASAARPASTSAMTVPMIGMARLTIAHTRAATANGSVVGGSPHPPGPPP